MAGVRGRLMRAAGADPVVAGYAARVSVWARWLVWVVAVAELAYRPQLWWAADREYLWLSVPLVAFNGLAHWRLRRGGALSWGSLVALSGMDVALISAAVVIGGEFHLFVYVAYYPALPFFAVVSTSLWLGLAWTTMTAAVYGALSTAVGPGLDVGAGQEKGLAARLAAMYAVVASVSLVARFERSCRLESARREQQLASERIELCTLWVPETRPWSLTCRDGADAESSCTESRADSWSQDRARNPWSAPTTELWAPTAAPSEPS